LIADFESMDSHVGHIVAWTYGRMHLPRRAPGARGRPQRCRPLPARSADKAPRTPHCARACSHTGHSVTALNAACPVRTGRSPQLATPTQAGAGAVTTVQPDER
jgi:hypothetical protein